MKTRLNEVPSLREMPSTVQASHYNAVRLALLRLGKPLRIELEGLRHLDMLLDDEAWVCVDRMLNDLPVVAWTDFQNENRSSLTEPVRCRLRLFHAHAGAIIPRALSSVANIINTYLAPENKNSKRDVRVLDGKAKR